MIAIRNTFILKLQQCVTDPEGRYIFLNCTINNMPYTLVSIYAPNHGQMAFLKKTLQAVRKFQQGHLIICGDFNMVLNNTLDSTAGSKQYLSPLDAFISANGLYDVWRCCQAIERDFTFLSPRHNTYSRIDLFLADKWLLQRTSNSAIHTATWSDHAPISITMSDESRQPNSYIWRANNYLLNTPCYATPIEQNLEQYFSLNQASVSDPLVVWNAHKAVIRGVFLQMGARAKKNKTQHLDDLTAAIATTESLNKSNPSARLQSRIFTLRQELRSILLEKHEKSYRTLKASSYTTGNKAGKAMSLRVKGYRNKTKILFLHHPHTNEKLLKPQSIANAFSTYYEDLYNLKDDPTTN